MDSDLLWPLLISALFLSIDLAANYMTFISDPVGVELSTVACKSVLEGSTVVYQSVSEGSTIVYPNRKYEYDYDLFISMSDIDINKSNKKYKLFISDIDINKPYKKHDWFISDIDINQSYKKFILIFGYIFCLSIAIPEIANIIMDLLCTNSDSVLNPYIQSVIAQSSNIITDLLCKSAHSAMVIASSSDNPSIAADIFVHMAADAEAAMYEIIINTRQLILASPDVNDEMIIAANESLGALEKGAQDFIDHLYREFDPIIYNKHK